MVLFSLKNPTYPEYVCNAPGEVMCVDIHPKHPHIIVVGLVRGNVAVYNLQSKENNPSHISTNRNGKHKDIVWKVLFERFFILYKSPKDKVIINSINNNQTLIFLFMIGKMGQRQY